MSVHQKTADGVTFYESCGIAAAGGCAHGFSTRLGGVSQGIWSSMNLGSTRGDEPEHVRENYRRFLGAIGAGSGVKMAMTHQVHRNEVRQVQQEDLRTDPMLPVPYEADGLVTDMQGVALVIYSADCIPVLFWDPVRRVIAAAHAGWRGTAAGIVQRAVEQMQRLYGCEAGNILAAIGPGICPTCFETHEDVPDAMEASLGHGVRPWMQEAGGGKYYVDLKGINRYLLEQSGLAPEHIEVCEACTCCTGSPDLFWSHRRVGLQRGSMAAAIAIAP